MTSKRWKFREKIHLTSIVTDPYKNTPVMCIAYIL